MSTHKIESLFFTLNIESLSQSRWKASNLLNAVHQLDSYLAAQEFGDKGEKEPLVCSSESLPVPFPVSMSPMYLNGWLNPSLNFQRRVTSEACQATVSTIITERSQWVIVFCLFTLLSSLIISSLSISSEPPSSPSALSPPLSLFGFDWSPSAEEVNSPGFVKASGFWSRSLPSNDSTCQ